MTEQLPKTFTYNQAEIIKAVLYFDVFNYPLTQQELFENAAISLSYTEFMEELAFLLDQKILKQHGDFIQSTTGTAHDIQKRLRGNAGAKEIMPLALVYSRKVASFPFVQAVFLSGALSKNYYDEKGDIDFFIVTKPNRLWICRTLLILRYKFLSKEKRKYWCTNYFISSDDMYIPDNNVFTSTELAHLVPTVNYGIYQNLLEKNTWYRKNFPNKPPHSGAACVDTPHTVLKSFTEKLLGGKPGAWLDNFLLYITLRHWQRKYPELSNEDFELQFRSRKNVCKRHTKGFQNKTLIQWQEKQRLFELNFNAILG